jgi:hypothetical protein
MNPRDSIAGLVFFCLGFLCFMLMMYCAFSFLSGWRIISARYGTEEKPRGTRIRCFRNSQVGWVYMGLIIRVCSEGIFLTPTYPCHDRVFLPWVAIRNAEICRDFGRCVRFVVGYPPVAVQLPGKVLESPETLLNLPMLRTGAAGG